MNGNKIINFASYDMRIGVNETKIKMLHSYWKGLAKDSKMPLRDDFNPLNVRPLISDLFTILHETGTGYYVSFAGQNVMRFLGVAFTDRHEDVRFPCCTTKDLDTALDRVFNKGRPARCVLTSQDIDQQAGCLGLFPFSQQGPHPIQAVCVLDLYTAASQNEVEQKHPSNVVDLKKRLERHPISRL